MKIGVIGPQSSCGIVVKNIADIDPDLLVNTYPRERVDDCGEVMDQCERECDVILFSGCAIESFVRERRQIRKPCTSIEKSIISVAGAFLKMQKEGMELDAFSIDVVEKTVVEDLLDAFHILARNIYLCPFQPGANEQEYVDWHISMQEQGKTNVALTAFAWVYRSLEQQGYKTIYLGATRAMVRAALERLKNGYALTRAEDSRIAVEIINLPDYEKSSENYYGKMIEKTEIEKEIVQYVKGVQGAVFPYGRSEYVVFLNAGVVKGRQSQNQILALQQRIQQMGSAMYAGVGLGATAYQAEMNARKALEYSLKKAKHEIYQITEDNILTGPFGMEGRLEYELISSDPKINDIAKKTGLSAGSVLKIIAIANARKSFVFDAHELADCLEVTARSARRIMNRIMDAGFGKVYAKETPVAGGRPKTLIEIVF